MYEALRKRMEIADKASKRYFKAKHTSVKQAAQVRCKYLDVCIAALTTIAGELVVSGEDDELLRIVQDTVDVVGDTQDLLTDMVAPLQLVESALNN